MKTLIPISLLMLPAAALGATAKAGESGNIISQITGGFTAIIGGSLGLKLAVAIVAVIGVAVGFWRGNAGLW